MNTTTSTAATLRVTAGPDRGKVFRISDDLVHVGRGPQNQIELTDPGVAEHQVSIVRRNGRYAIYAPLEGAVQIDGSPLPAERWVWLPANARIRFGEQTAVEFHSGRLAAEPPPPRADDADQTPSPPPAPRRPETRKPPTEKRSQRQAPRAAKAERKVARFITDQTGDHLVTLGEDGHLPELTLAEGSQRRPARQQRSEKGSALIYAAVGVSVLLSMAMLLIDTGPSGSTADERARARQIIAKEYFGDDETGIEPYQRWLREAQRSHARGSRVAEHRAYRRVLDLLNSEDSRKSFNGLTGSRKNDERLRELIGVLLNE